MHDSRALVITGGAQGIGACIARLAAKRGRAVAVLYRTRREAAEQLVRDMRSTGAQAAAIAADVGDEGDVTRAFDKIDATFGGVSGLVNNAVLPGVRNEFLDWTPDQVEAVFGPTSWARSYAADRRCAECRSGTVAAAVP